MNRRKFLKAAGIISLLGVVSPGKALSIIKKIPVDDGAHIGFGTDRLIPGRYYAFGCYVKEEHGSSNWHEVAKKVKTGQNSFTIAFNTKSVQISQPRLVNVTAGYVRKTKLSRNLKWLSSIVTMKS